MSIDIPPEKAFGQRDPSKVRLVPLRKFGEKAYELKVGDEVEYEGRIGVVQLIGSGRVQVDFNHRLAGKTLTYSIEVVKKLEEPLEKAVALIKRWINVDEKKVTVTLEDKTLTIKLPEETYLFEGLQIGKRGIARDIFKYLSEAEKVIFVEEYLSERKAEPKQSEQKEEGKEAEEG